MKIALLRSLTLVGLLQFGGLTIAAELKPYTEVAINQIDHDKSPVILAFHSASCTSCKKQKTILDTLLKEEQMSSFAAFRIDFDRELDLREKYNVNSPSTIIVLQDGKEITRTVAETSIEVVRKLLLKGVKS